MSSPTIEIERGDLAAVPEAVAAELRATGFFSELTVLVADPTEIMHEIDNIVAQARGLAILVETPEGTNNKPGIFGALRFDDVAVAVTVTEDVTANRSPTGTGLHALRVLAEVMRRLHGYQPKGASQMLSCRSFGRVDDPEGQLLVYRARFSTAINLGSSADLRERRPV